VLGAGRGAGLAGGLVTGLGGAAGSCVAAIGGCASNRSRAFIFLTNYACGASNLSQSILSFGIALALR